jgi:hypothetical protein
MRLRTPSLFPKFYFPNHFYLSIKPLSITGYDFCYQHIDLFNGKNKDKFKVCSWREENGEKCNQLALCVKCDQSDLASAQSYCITHSALSRLKQRAAEAKSSSSKYKLIKDDDDNNDQQEAALVLSEQAFLKNNQWEGERRKENERKRKLLSSVKSRRSKKRLTTDDRVNVDEEEEEEETTTTTKTKTVNGSPGRANSSDTRGLLDSDDSLDAIMLNMINNYKKDKYRAFSSLSSSSSAFEEEDEEPRDQATTSGEIQLDYDQSLGYAHYKQGC